MQTQDLLSHSKIEERIDNIHKNHEYSVGPTESEIKNIHMKSIVLVSFVHQTSDYHQAKKITEVLYSGVELKSEEGFIGIDGVIEKFTDYHESKSFYKNIMSAIRKDPIFNKMSNEEITQHIQEALPAVQKTLKWVSGIVQSLSLIHI